MVAGTLRETRTERKEESDGEPETPTPERACVAEWGLPRSQSSLVAHCAEATLFSV